MRITTGGLNPTSVLLILLFTVASREALGVECRRRLLTGDEQRTLEAFVLKSTGLPVDRYSIEACRDLDTVFVDTLRAPQPDGTERFAMLSCYPMRKEWPERWHCIGEPMTGFRADTFPGQLGVWVGIDTPTAPPLARRLVAQGFALLARDGTVPSCVNGETGARTLASLRTEITSGAGILLLGREPDRFRLSGGEVIVYFQRDSQDTARLQCWIQEDVVVTG